MSARDENNSDSELIYRRIPEAPGFLVPDLETGRRVPTHTAFRWDPDGISVHRSSLLTEYGLGPEAMVKKPGQMVYGFPARATRPCKAKIIDAPDPEDPPIGMAHALIQCEVPRPDKPRRREISEALAEESRLCFPAE
ncbi:hypothetical protein ACWC5C_00565 [Streptomyces sp. NPDC001700]